MTETTRRQIMTGTALLIVAVPIWVALLQGLCFASPGFFEPGVHRIPLLLLGEPVSGSGFWENSGFIKQLEKSGYQVEKNVFVSCPKEPYLDLAEGSGSVARIVTDVMAKTSFQQIDVVSFGTSGLVARFALEFGYIDSACIRNLVMVGSPNKGTFVAEIIKSLVEVVGQEAALEKATRSARFIPFVGGPLDTLPLERSLLTAPQGPWESESLWIRDRAEGVYEPLYASYVAERHLAIPYIPANSPKETFAGWISQSYPQLWQKAVLEGVDPPLFRGVDTLPAGGGMPRAGEDLSCAYYELLAMDVARNLYVMRTASKGGLAESLMDKPYIPVSWRDALFHYGERLLAHYAGKALITVKSEIQKAFSDWVAVAGGFVGGRDAPLLRRLIREETVVNLGTSVKDRFQKVPANRYLSDINALSVAASTDRKTRYVTVAGVSPNLLSLVWPQIASNDFYCEVDSAVAPLGLRDAVRVFSGILSTFHKGLLGDKNVQNYILSVLADRDQSATAKEIGQNESVSLKISSWTPAYLVPGDGVGAIDFTLPEPPPGWAYSIWHDDGSRAQPVTNRSRSGVLRVALPPDSGKVGVRLICAGQQGLTTSTGKTESAFLKEVVGCVEAAGFPVSDQPWGSDNQGCDQTNPDPKTWPDTGVLPDLPLIRAVYRTKRTTLKDPVETYHCLWSLDFGDGHKQVISGEPVLCLEYRYSKQGTYRAQAVSYDNDGNEILTKTWDVVATATDTCYTFMCTSVRKQEVDLVLQGPQKWVTGKPAEYRGCLEMDQLPEVRVASATFDPGQQFMVLWERAGDFQVSCAVTLKLEYNLEGRVISVKNTYVTHMPVTVLTTGVTN